MNSNYIEDNAQTELKSEMPALTEDNQYLPPKDMVLIFRLAVSVVIAVTLFLIKSFGGSVYENIRNFYFTNMNNSVITEFSDDSEDSLSDVIYNEN